MSEAALEEASVLASIYCGEGEYQLLQQSAEDGLVIQINTTVGAEREVELSLVFRMPPHYPSCPPDISVSSPLMSRGRCQHIRQKLLEQATTLPEEPMVHQLVDWLQCKMPNVKDYYNTSQQFPDTLGKQTLNNIVLQRALVALPQSGEVTEGCVEEEERLKEREEWTTVLSLDHMRSRGRYTKLLERWSQQLQLTGRLLLGRHILIILQGARPDIKEFCHLLKTVKVDVDSSGKKCKERMMKVLCEGPSSSPCRHGPSGFIVKDYHSLSELAAVFQELNMPDVQQQILSSLTDNSLT